MLIWEGHNYMQRIIGVLICIPCFAMGATCPSGFVVYENDVFVQAVSDECPSGYVAHDVTDVCSGATTGVCWVAEQLRALCGAGLTQIKTSGGLSIPLYADKLTSPSIHVRYNNVTCYADLESGRASDAINLGVGGVIYHTVK